MRLDKYLASAGKGTRRTVKEYIKKGQVTVNDQTIRDDSYQVDETNDVVTLFSEVVDYQKFYYILLNKPEGYVSATTDKIYPPVTDLVSEYDFANIVPVGRLDVDTTGVLLLTNDGQLNHRLLAPKFHVDKTYYIETDFPIDKKMIAAFKEGIILDGEKTLPGDLEIIDEKKAYLTIHQGKFHQVKRMFQYFSLKVLTLDRVKFAFLTYDGLNRGEYRLLTKEEIRELKKLAKQEE